MYTCEEISYVRDNSKILEGFNDDLGNFFYAELVNVTHEIVETLRVIVKNLAPDSMGITRSKQPLYRNQSQGVTSDKWDKYV